MNKNYIKVLGLSLFLISLIFCFRGYSDQFNSKQERDTVVESIGNNNLHLAATNNYILDRETFWGDSGSDVGLGITLDGEGNFFLCGYTTSFGMGGYDVFIAKYDSDGNLLMNITWGGSGYEIARCIVVDSSENVYVTGYTRSFGAGGDDAYIVKYNDVGTQLWNTTWGDSGDEDANAIVLDGAGNIFITGYTTSFGAGNWDAFIAKFDNSGTSLKNITWGYSGGDESANDITLDSGGNIFITGRTLAATNNAFITKFDSTGIQLWNTTWGGISSDVALGITLDESGNIYITGSTLSFGPGGDDAFIVKYNNAGIQLWNATWGGSDSDCARCIMLDSEGYIFITGYTYSFGAGDYDAFIAKYDDTGTSLLNITWGDSGEDTSSSISFDGEGNFYITGKTTSFGAMGYDAFVVKYKIKSSDTNEEPDLSITGPSIILIAISSAISILLISKKFLKTHKMHRT